MRALKVPAARWIGVCVLCAYPFLLHATFLWARSSAVGTALIWAELAAVAALSIYRFRRWRLALILAIGAAAIILAAHSETTTDAIVVASGLPFAAAYIGLLILFATSLAPGRKPIISLVSEKLSGEKATPELASYTRAVTILWCCFFAFQLTVSLLLYLYASAVIWSFFVNVLNLPLNIILFLGEYTYRRYRFPGRPRHGLFAIMRILLQKNGVNFWSSGSQAAND
jgi:uncharacterized membrane protein